MYDAKLIDELTIHDPNIDKSLVAKALDFAVKYHGNQKRDSGEPYYTHPIAVAKIVANLKFDASTIITAILHDTIEDTELTLEEINKNFGPEIASLVDGVTKLKRVKLNKDQVHQAENFRKLFLAMVADIRVLVVKIADRLHNMRTISFKSDEKRRKISLETLEIYSPLAERVGFHKIKNELQEISFRNLYPEVYEMVIKKLNNISENRKSLIENIVIELTDVLASHGLKAEVCGRQKEPYSIWTKMVNKNIAFDNLSDIMGFRILVGTQDDCYKALGIIHSSFKVLPGTFHDFISIPKQNGYQSLHTLIIGPMQKQIEIQIRTYEMHQVAEVGLAAHWTYKQGYQDKNTEQYRWMRELISIIEHSNSSEEMLHHTKLAMYQNQIFCFTPGGDIITLPKKATAIDFAYALSSDFGHHCIGVKINGTLMPLPTELKTGDMVEVLASDTQHPIGAWEDWVVTGKAKAEIRKYLRSQDTEVNINLGKNILENALLSINISNFDKVLSTAATKLNKTLEELYLKVGTGEISTKEVIDTLDLKPSRLRSIFRFPKFKKVTQQEIQHSPIAGLIPGISMHFAKCCNPIPGDKIVGIVYSGKGVTIHIKGCKVYTKVGASLDKILNLSWRQLDTDLKYAARIRIISHRDDRVVNLIVGHLSKLSVRLINMQVKKVDEFFNDILCDIEVIDTEALNNLLSALNVESLIHSAKRVV
ncbi:RelA/SpoT family protein [Candidatus Phycorickettsia trachydisci]|nr:bifunctional (p)ppGpp synthetase/guanosine-3',5'-bis(diphosphate) 3'-pyrophosphohydrolase [Candidatus Phycorickettsia trachydisci]